MLGEHRHGDTGAVRGVVQARPGGLEVEVLVLDQNSQSDLDVDLLSQDERCLFRHGSASGVVA